MPNVPYRGLPESRYLGVFALGFSLLLAPQTTSDRVYSEAQAAEGATVYMASCAGCHQDDLSGGEDAPPLVGPSFSGVWEGRTLDALVDRMQRLMPQDAPGSLTRQQYTAITA